MRWDPIAAPALLLVLLLLSPSTGGAQEPAASPDPASLPPLTLQEAVDRALRQNPAYRRTTNNLELSDIEHRSAWLDLLPQPTVNLLSTNMSWQRQTVAEDFFGNPLENPESQTVQTSRSQQGFSVGFEVDLGNVVGLRQQETQSRLRELGAVTERRSLVAEVTRSFSQVVELQGALELEEQLLAEAERNLEAARRLFSLAQRDRTDVLTAELDVAEQENVVARVGGELRSARLALRNLMGDPELVDFQVAAEEVPVFDPGALDREGLVARALQGSPRILEGEGGIEAARQGVTQERLAWLPRLNVGFNRNRQEFLRDGSAFFSVNPDGEWSQTLFFQVNLPDPALYFRRQNSARRARLEVRNQEESLREVRLQVEEEVRRLLVELETSYRSVVLQDRRVALAEERLSLQLQSYRLGQGTFLELQSASEAAAQARRQALDARFSFHRTRVELERVLGEDVGGGQGAAGPGQEPGG